MLKKPKKPGATPQEEGRLFEKFWAKLFGVKPVRGSGNIWYAKLDVNSSTFLFSCKNTKNKSFSVSKEIMKEVEEAINGQGGMGGETIPALASAIENEEVYVTMRAEDFMRLIQSDQSDLIVPTKGEQKRARSQIPGILRED